MIYLYSLIFNYKYMGERGPSFNPAEQAGDKARLAAAKEEMNKLFASDAYKAELASKARMAEAEHARTVEGTNLADDILSGVPEFDQKKAA